MFASLSSNKADLVELGVVWQPSARRLNNNANVNDGDDLSNVANSSRYQSWQVHVMNNNNTKQ